MGMLNLPRDLMEEIFSKLPVTSLRAVRLTCKKWNSVSKTRSFAEKHINVVSEDSAREVSVIMVMDNNVYLMGVNLSGTLHKNVYDPSIKPQGKLTTCYNNNDLESVDIYRVFHCDGLLLLFVKKDFDMRLVVWNPYWGKQKWIRPKCYYCVTDTYSIGYEKKKNNKSCPSDRNHKILRRFTDGYGINRVSGHEIYNFNSNSWRVLDITPPDSDILYYEGVSLKGDTYRIGVVNRGEENVVRARNKKFLICFDFTKERLGPRLTLPFDSYLGDIVALSSNVRGKQLALAFQQRNRHEMELWVTSKIKPETVSWTKFFAVDTRPFTTFRNTHKGFFIDEDKKVVVTFDKDDDETRNVAHIIGEDGCFTKLDLGEATHTCCDWPLICFYVPSSVDIKQSFS